MSVWDRFLADAVPTAVMFTIAVTGFGASHLVAFLAGVGFERRRRQRAWFRRQRAFDAHIHAQAQTQAQETVPLPSVPVESDTK